MRFETYEREGKRGTRFYWRMVGDNNEKMGPSQPYRSAEARDKTVRTIKAEAELAPVRAVSR